MKGKLIAFASILCIVSLMASGAYAVKPDKPPGKPDKPGNTETTTETITFTGDSLIGIGEVEGCCPGQGPYPPYTMYVGFAVPGYPEGGTVPGVLYINEIGNGHDRKYQVDFWDEHDDLGHVSIRIIGGEITKDKKNKTVTVVFTDADCVDIHGGAFIAKVNFTLVRAQI